MEDTFADHQPNLTLYDEDFGAHAWKLSETAKVAFTWLICPMEVKSQPKDASSSNDNDGLTSSFEGDNFRVQISRYVAETFLHQHREFVFSVSFTGREACLMRWDRCGTVVSKAFDYVDNPAPLLNFVHRLARASRATQGFDTSVRLASLAQISDLRAYKETQKLNRYEKQFVDEIMADEKLYPINQVCRPT